MQATLLTLAIAAILALLAALLGPHFIDWNTHRAAFEQQASQAIGLPVRVTGPMDVRLLPSPTLVLSGVEIGHPDDAQALRAKALGIEFALPPLLSGNLRAVELRLIAPEMRLSLTQDGRALLPDALAGMKAQGLSIDKLVIEDASLQLADSASGANAVLRKLWFNGEVRALSGPIRGEGAFVMDGSLYGYRIATARPEANGSRIKFTIDPADRPVSAELEGLLTAAEGVPRFDGTATVARRVAVKGDKGDTAEPWRISARVKANAASALFEQVEYQYGPEERALKLSGTAEAKFGARPRIDAVLTARTLDADKLLGASGDVNQSPRAALAALISAAERIIGPPIPTQVGFGIDALSLGGASLQNIRGDVEFGRGRMTLTAFEARGPGFTQVQASGQIEKADGHLSFAGPVDVTSNDPRAFADWLEGKAATSALPARPLRFRGELTLGADKIAIAGMRAEFDGKAFDGDLSYVFANGAAPAQFAAALRADELDIDAWMAAAGSLEPFAGVEPPEDVTLALSLKRLRFGGLEAGNTDIRLSLNADALSIEKFAVADMAGLSIDGRGRADIRAQRGSGSFNIAILDAKAVGALAKRAPAILVPPLERIAQAAAPGKLAATVGVEPGDAGNSRITIALGGALGAVDLKLKTALDGQWSDIANAALSLDASLNTADVNALLKIAAAERLLSVPRQSGTYTLSLKGGLADDLRLDTRIVSANLDMRASGTIRPFASDAPRASLDLAVGSADLVLPGRSANTVPVALKARLVRDASGLRFDDLSATVAGSAVRGRLGLGFGETLAGETLAGETLAIDGELRTDRIDIGAVFAVLSGSERPGKGDRPWSETPYAPLSLPKLSGWMNVSAAQATLADMQVSKFRSTLRFEGTDVTAEAVEGQVLGGRLSAEMTVRRGPDGLGLRGQVAITDADATQLLFGEGAAPMTGQAALTLQFEGLGRSPRALIGSLNGSGTLVLDHARIAALNPNVFAVATHSVDQGLPIDAPRVREMANRGLDAGPLVVPHAEATLSIAGGVARIDTFTAQAEAADLSVTGSYDFSNSRIDLRLAMSGPADGASLQPEVAVQLRGPAAKPERMLDVSALTGWLALRSVDRHTKKIEAIEQRRATQDDADRPQPEAAPQKSETPADPPRRKPPQPAAQSSPAPVEARPAVSERPRASPQRAPSREPQRVETPPQGGANPFPTPIGSPPPPSRVQPVPPQTMRPFF